MIQSIERALKILHLFSASRPALGLSDIGRILNLHVATVQGIVKTLVKGGLLQQNPDTRKYGLGLKLYELGSIWFENLEINQNASNPIYELAESTQQHVRLAILNDFSALITLDAYPMSQPFLTRGFGFKVPLYCTAIGKALLAYMKPEDIKKYLRETELVAYTPNTIIDKRAILKELEKIRRSGFSINRGENFTGRAAVGAPIFDRTGKVVASLCVAGDPSYILKTIEKLSFQLLKTSQMISKSMGYFPGSI
jgi:DNA-binding IclR family transcriptional regulator